MRLWRLSWTGPVDFHVTYAQDVGRRNVTPLEILLEFLLEPCSDLVGNGRTLFAQTMPLLPVTDEELLWLCSALPGLGQFSDDGPV